MTDLQDFQIGQIAALQEALKQIIWTFPNAPQLIEVLRQNVAERPNVVDLVQMPPKCLQGYLATLDILGKRPQ